MQEMNCIHLSRPDYPAISSSAMVPTFAPGAVESNLPQAVENLEIPAEFLNASQSLPEKRGQKVTSLSGYLSAVAHSKNFKYVRK
jgi:hypothetical protein